VAALKGWPSRLMGLVTDRDPGDVIDVLERKGLARDPSVGLHFFAFGGWKKTLDWIARRRG
jgi:methylenetetrahydrofolate reductase (NADPH)